MPNAASLFMRRQLLLPVLMPLFAGTMPRAMPMQSGNTRLRQTFTLPPDETRTMCSSFDSLH